MAKKNKSKATKNKAKSPKKAVKTATKIKRERKAKVYQIKLKHFKDNKGGHPHVIVDNVGRKKVSVGITHDKLKGKGATNYGLSLNPLGKKEKAYLKRQGTVADKSNYYRPQQGVMTAKDYAVAKKYGKRAKEKYINKKSSEVPNTH